MLGSTEVYSKAGPETWELNDGPLNSESFSTQVNFSIISYGQTTSCCRIDFDNNGSPWDSVGHIMKPYGDPVIRYDAVAIYDPDGFGVYGWEGWDSPYVITFDQPIQQGTPLYTFLQNNATKLTS